MDELEIKIALSFKILESDLTFNGIVQAMSFWFSITDSREKAGSR